jgi:hypothetical protein
MKTMKCSRQPEERSNPRGNGNPQQPHRRLNLTSEDTPKQGSKEKVELGNKEKREINAERYMP